MRASLYHSVLCVLGVLLTQANAGPNNVGPSIGGGAHYYRTVDDVKISDVDEDGLGWYGSYQYRGSQLGAVEVDFEFLPDGFAGSVEDVYAPQLYLIGGSGFYGGVGVGWYYADSEWADDPFYALRLGVNFELFSGLFLDINGNYRFTKWDTDVTQDIGTDTVTLAAALRLSL